MVKCDICKKKVESLFLGKIKGTYVKDKGSSRKKAICSECQKKLHQDISSSNIT